jgi:hypothetical protein
MANAPAASAGRPNNEHESDDEDEPVQTTAPERDPGNCVEPGNASHYGQFTWTVALPAAPADKDSLADISKIRQFRWAGLLIAACRSNAYCCIPEYVPAVNPGGHLVWARVGRYICWVVIRSGAVLLHTVSRQCGRTLTVCEPGPQ